MIFLAVVVVGAFCGAVMLMRSVIQPPGGSHSTHELKSDLEDDDAML